MFSEHVSDFMNWSDLVAILVPGDLVEICHDKSSPSGHKHWAVYAGICEGFRQIIHYSDNVSEKPEVRLDPLENVAGGSQCRKNNAWDGIVIPLPPSEILRISNKMVGEEGRSLSPHNCEDFANFCRYGEQGSEQKSKNATSLDRLTSKVAFGAQAPTPQDSTNTGAPPNAARRLRACHKYLLQEPIPNVRAAPLSCNILEWHYVITGASDTPYAGGQYHGSMIFPDDYPFQPPSIYMFTPNGRFQTNTSIWLSILQSDEWNGTWTPGMLVLGLLSLMSGSEPVYNGVVSTAAEKQRLARESRAFNVKNRVFCELFEDLAELKRSEMATGAAQDVAASAAADLAEAVSEKQTPEHVKMEAEANAQEKEATDTSKDNE